MKKLLAMAVPILPGKTAQFKKFTADLRTSRFEEFAASRRRLKIHERVFLQTTPKGDFALVTLEGDDPQNALKMFGQGSDAFTKWFVQQVKEIHGYDLIHPPKDPLPEMLIDSQVSAPVHN